MSKNFETRRKGNFLVMSSTPLRDKNLGGMERGLLATMLDKPQDWIFSIRKLAAELPDGRDKIANSLKKLENQGYIKRQRMQKSNGEFTYWKYIVTDEPILLTDDDGNIKNLCEVIVISKNFEIRRKGNFLVMSSTPLRDKNLGGMERGLLATMLDKPENWDFSVSRLVEEMPDGKAKIKTSLRKLEDLKYLKRKQVVFDGKFGHNKYIVTDEPELLLVDDIRECDEFVKP